MSKQEIIDAVRKLLFEDSGNLSREEYRELLDEVGSDIDSSLDALDLDDSQSDE